MSFLIKSVLKIVVLFLSFWTFNALADESVTVPILVYHVLNPTVPSSMTITPQALDTQLKWIKDNGYTVIPLKQLVSYMQGQNITLPAKPIVISADDGWESDYTYLLPLAKKYNVPVTLFIYPSVISHSSHFLTWEQIEELIKTGLFDIQAHTYSHPNFNDEKKRLSADAYSKLVNRELFDSKKTLEDKLGIKINFLAWPYGIHNAYLEQQAAKAGYEMSFTIADRHATRSFRPMAEPRYMIVASESMGMFAAIVKGNAQGKTPSKDLKSAP